MKLCGEEQVLLHLSLFLYEYLGEEYPAVLASILNAMRSIVAVVGAETSGPGGGGSRGSLARMTPPIKDLLPRLTPILRNRHEKVQEAVITLIGRIADRGPELAPPHPR